MQINAAVLFADLHRFIPHTALADHPAQPEIANHLPLVRLLSNRSCWPCRDAFPITLVVFDHYRPAMIKDTSFKVYARGKFAALMQILMDRVSTREQNATDRDL